MRHVTRHAPRPRPVRTALLAARTLRAAGALLAASALFAAGAVAADRWTPEGTRAVMRGVAASLSSVLGASAGERGLDDPRTRARSLSALRSIGASAEALEAHAPRTDAGFDFLTKRLAEDAREAHRRLAAGRGDEAAYFVGRIADTCVDCHSRSPDRELHDLAPTLVPADALARRPPAERARLLVATRRYDEALDAFEQAFVDPASRPESLDARGDLAEYLRVALVVRRDPARAARNLASLQARPDLPFYLSRSLASWTAAASAMAERPSAAPSIASARDAAAAAAANRSAAGTRESLVLDLAAASEATRLLAQPDLPPALRAEALYLLGLAESRAGRSFAESEASALLAAAIRAMPDAAFALDAFAVLEGRQAAAWSGSAGTDMPIEVTRELDELRALIPALRPGERARRGARTYVDACAHCHGLHGRGDGPGAAAGALGVSPGDLTTLASRAGGTFPRDRVRAVIDGREPVPGHRGLEMPAFALSLREVGRDATAATDGVAERIDEVVEHLESIQR